MPTLFVFTVIAPEGTWHSYFHLEPGRCYRADEVQVEQGGESAPSSHTLTVNATALPSKEEFREMAACAATRTADDSPDPLRRRLNLLIPF